MTQLFQEIELPTITKRAMDAPLSSSADRWVGEVYTEIHEQHPYLSTYDVLPHMENVNGEQGYGMGTIVVRNRHALPDIGPGMREKMKQEGVKFIRVPILIVDGKLKPLDLAIDEKGEVCPLNETRVRELLYRPNLFDTSLKKNDGPPYDRLFLPALRGGGEYVKTGSEKEYVLEEIATTIDRGSVQKVAEELAGDKTLAQAVGMDPVVSPFLEFIDSLKPVGAEDIVKTAEAMMLPDVIQVQRVDDHYLIKVACTDSFAPRTLTVDFPTAVELLGEHGMEIVKEANETGMVTVTTKPTVDIVLDEEPGEEIERFGEWRVKGQDGIERVGWVFPEVRSFSGIRLPMKVFNNGDICSFQDKIVGSFVGSGVNLTRGPIEGQGMFYRITDQGSVVAFEPVEVINRSIDGDQLAFEVTPLSKAARSVMVKTVSGLKTVSPLDTTDSSFGLPEDIRWMPLASDMVPLTMSQDAFAKIGAAELTISGGGGLWNFSGPVLHKIAKVMDIRGLRAPDAMFLASCLGMAPEVAFHHLDKVADYGGPVRVNGCRACVLAEERGRMSEAHAHVKTAGMVLPRQPSLLAEAVHLSKVALEDDDIDTVDRVLSLNFLNSTNLGSFVEHLPDFNNTVKKLAGLLLAVRLGQKDVDEAAVKNSMDSIEEVIGGLRKLVHRRDVEKN